MHHTIKKTILRYGRLFTIDAGQDTVASTLASTNRFLEAVPVPSRLKIPFLEVAEHPPLQIVDL
jgi:hypothetical protein